MKSRFNLPVALLALVAGLSGTLAQGAETTLDKIRRTGQISITYREASIPFSYTVDGKPVGYAFEMCKLVAQAVQKKLGLSKLDIKTVPVTSANRVEAIVKGTADLECGSTTNNATRRKDVAFTVPHYIAGARLLVHSGKGIHSIDDLKGKKVVLTKGTTTIGLMRAANDSRVLNLTFIEAGDHAEAVSMVEAGTADAFAMDDVLLFSLRAASKDPSKLEVVGELLSIEPLAMMLRKDDPEFKRLVDTEMSRIVLDGEGARLYRKWFNEPIPPKGTVLNLPQSHLLKDAWRFPTDSVAD